MNQSAASTFLPEWALAFAFFASLILALLQIFRIAKEVFEESALEVRLTRELFTRVTDLGEIIFLNPIYLAKNGNVLIRSVDLKLRRVSNPEKTFALAVLHLGEKVQESGQRFANFSFLSSSPTDLIAKDVPKRSVYMTVISEYAAMVHGVFREFRHACTELRRELDAKGPIAEFDQEKKAALFRRITEIVSRAESDLNKLTQLEVGKYEIRLSVRYTPLSRRWLLRRDKWASSAIAFEVGDDIKRLSFDIRKMFSDEARDRVLQEQITALFPEYYPQAIQELDH